MMKLVKLVFFFFQLLSFKLNNLYCHQDKTVDLLHSLV